MPRHHRRHAPAQSPATTSRRSASPSNSNLSPPPTMSESPLVPSNPTSPALASSGEKVLSPAPAPANPAWLTRDLRPWGEMLKPVEPAPAEMLPTPESPLSAPPPRLPSRAASEAPTRPPSAASCGSHSSGDSGALLQPPRSMSSHVTSISIPPSVGSTRVNQAAPTSFPSRPIVCHAPVPMKKIISPLSSMCSKSMRHSMFYFPDDLVTLSVDGCLFRVHKSYLERESSYFRRLFVKEAGRGASDETAIDLPQVTIAAFEQLLKLVYFGTHEPCAYSVEAWISLLAASTALSFPRIRERALAALESDDSCLDAVDRLLLADRYGVDAWRAPAYVQLCARERPLQESEAALLGAKVASQLAEIRERVLLEMLEACQARGATTKRAGARAPWAKPSRDVRRVEQMVDEVFWPHEVPISCRS